MSTSAKPKRYGLRLTQPNVTTARVVPGWPGFYRHDIATPIGEPGDVISLDDAKARLTADVARIDRCERDWTIHEEEQVAMGNRPYGPLAFGDFTDIDGKVVLVRPVPALELVTIKASDVTRAEQTIADTLVEARNGVVALRAEKLNEAEKDQLADDRAALKGADA